MFVPRRLSNKLSETLGDDAAEDLVTLIDRMGSSQNELREAIRADIAELRQEMHAGFGQLRDNLRDQLRHEIHGVETNLADRIHAVDKRVDQRYADLMKWSFVFWVGAVGAIALLAGVMR